eukprot:1251146-Rhodomonas_salina.1
MLRQSRPQMLKRRKGIEERKGNEESSQRSRQSGSEVEVEAERGSASGDLRRRRLLRRERVDVARTQR